MNIQHKILQNLDGLRGIPSAQFNSTVSDFSRGYAQQVNDLYNVNIPIKACEFVGVISFDGMSSPLSEYVLLTKLSKADSGFTFSQSSDSAYLPIPKVTVGSFSIESFIPRSWKGQLANLYYRQFDGGLLGCCFDRPNFSIAWMEVDEDTVTKNTELLVDSFKRTISQLKAQGADSEVMDDMYMFDTIDSEPSYDELMKSLPNVSERLHVILTYKHCTFGLPKFNIDPSSNDFLKMSLDVTYKDMESELVAL